MMLLIYLEMFTLKEHTVKEMVFNGLWHLHLGIYSLLDPNP